MFFAFQERSKKLLRLKSVTTSVGVPKAPIPPLYSLTGEDLCCARLLIKRFRSQTSSPVEIGFATAVKRAPLLRKGEVPKPGLSQDLVYCTNSDLGKPVKVDWVRRMQGRCLRCGSKGHRAASCREPPLCFICKQTGHSARAHLPKDASCSNPNPLLDQSSNSNLFTSSSSLSEFPYLPKKASSSPLSNPSNSKSSPSGDMSTKIRHLSEDEHIFAKLQELPRSIVIQADASIFLFSVICAMRKRYSLDRFSVSKLALERYHIVGPSIEWRNEQFDLGQFELKYDHNRRRFYKILKEAPQLEPKATLERRWVRTVDVPYG